MLGVLVVVTELPDFFVVPAVVIVVLAVGSVVNIGNVGLFWEAVEL